MEKHKYKNGRHLFAILLTVLMLISDSGIAGFAAQVPEAEAAETVEADEPIENAPEIIDTDEPAEIIPKTGAAEEEIIIEEPIPDDGEDVSDEPSEEAVPSAEDPADDAAPPKSNEEITIEEEVVIESEAEAIIAESLPEESEIIYPEYTVAAGQSTGTQLNLEDDLYKTAIAPIKAKVYDGQPYIPTVKVTAYLNGKKKTLIEGADYAVDFQNNINVGTGRAIVTGIGQFQGTLSREFVINPRSIGNAAAVAGSISVKDNVTESTFGKLPVTAYDGKNILVYGKDYTISADLYKLSQKGTRSIKLLGTGNYKGSKSVSITVCDDNGTAVLFKNCKVDIIWSCVNADIYDGTSKKPAVSVTMGGSVVPSDQYNVRYSNNKNAGTGYVTITGKKGYAGKLVAPFEIRPSSEPLYVPKAIPAKTFNGKLFKPTPTVKAGNRTLRKGKDYLITYSDNLHASTEKNKAVFVAEGIGNYAKSGTVKAEFEIKKCHIKKVTAAGSKEKGLVLTFNNTTLTEGDDYTIISYDENVRGNKVKVTLRGEGDFQDTTVKTVKYYENNPGNSSGGGVAPAGSSNKNRQNYTDWASPIQSYLIQNSDGSFTRVEYNSVAEKLWVENYSADKSCTSKKEMERELPRFGGFYAGANYYFMIFGTINYEEDNSKEVIRVVKYDKEWNRLGSASLRGANTVGAFEFGSLRADERDGILYVRTCHLMYASKNGVNHQANLTFFINESTMEIIAEKSGVSNLYEGYVSHSFNQFIKTDGTNLIAVDHGDAHPRSVVLIKYDNPMGKLDDPFYGCDSVHVLPISGESGDNDTGVSVGGFEVTGSSYVVAGNSIDQNASKFNPDGIRNIFVTVTDKNNFKSDGTSIRWITDYKSGSGKKVSTPQLVKISDTRLVLLWTEGSAVKYVYLDGNGTPTSDINSMNGALSDCHPIVTGDSVLWYYTSGGKPVFCSVPK